MNICAGAFIMNEKQFYTWGEMFAIFGCSLISIIGVFIIVKKPTSISDEPVIQPSPRKTIAARSSMIDANKGSLSQEMREDIQLIVNKKTQMKRSVSMDYLTARGCTCSLETLNLNINIKQFDKKPVEDKEEIMNLIQMIRKVMGNGRIQNIAPISRI
jgi:hypothetical protein